MESFNLKTASTYINNLLLARGLLRDGKPIEFAHPSRGEGGKEVTMAQIINLVHDLILKRDRDQEHRESIAGTLRTLRTEATRQTLALEKLQTRNDDVTRQLSLAQSQERSARVALRSAESSARSLREEMLRLKTTVQQVRTSCANDIRKRDVQMQRVKSHLTSQQRGNKTGLVGASITITPGNVGLNGAAGIPRDDGPDVDDPEYSLKQETTEFLTQLSQSLSDENDNLIGLVRSTLVTLKELQGMPESYRREDGEGLSMIGEAEEDDHTQTDMLQALPTSYETLATDMDGVLENLKTLLTNPSFVPIEEVEMREEEIVRLRAGWDRLESRWRDTLALMDGWRKRMANGGDTINLDDLKLGLGLGAGLDTVSKQEEVSIVSDDDDGDDGDDGASSCFDELEEAEEVHCLPSPEADVPDKTAASDMFSLKLQPGHQPALKEGNGNIKSPRKVAFAPSIPNTPSEVADENEGASGQEALQVNLSSPLSTPDSTAALYIDYAQTTKRLSSPHAHPDERSPKLTVQDKLKVAQAEAERAAVAEGARPVTARGAANGEDEVESKQQRRGSPVKTRIGGRPKRRKSTLTPDELQNLLGFD
ncbi:hypothetical protein P154DRAFT_448983 [Amniculicola lignicola CBS 123094]|uniref:NIMA interactive protein n=1 Tax=Amniculicola lignicola CBS 123094 TaxID=1392246 RepID=A0A6A5VYV7_9PLEO|nr:hypothetical protein P154DRAFT_448983 [Amniculicola lignicola CBS 123094]